MNKEKQKRQNICQLKDWYQQELGQRLLQQELEQLHDLTGHCYGDNVLQIGSLPHYDVLENSTIPNRYQLLETIEDTEQQSLVGEYTNIPLLENSMDLVLLLHVLEFNKRPRMILQEINRVLKPEGHLIVLGFNPMSLFGLRRFCTFSSHTQPWNGKFISIECVTTWLMAQRFEIQGSEKLFYLPPFGKHKVIEKFGHLDRYGAKYWHYFGASYLLAAQKKQTGLTPLRLKSALKHRLAIRKGLTQQPTTRSKYP